jgi:hypothetical protein
MARPPPPRDSLGTPLLGEVDSGLSNPARDDDWRAAGSGASYATQPPPPPPAPLLSYTPAPQATPSPRSAVLSGIRSIGIRAPATGSSLVDTGLQATLLRIRLPKLDRVVRRKNLAMFCVGVLGICSCVLQNEVLWLQNSDAIASAPPRDNATNCIPGGIRLEETAASSGER